MVSDVSAMFVATTIFRRSHGANTRCCSPALNMPNSGMISASRSKPALQQVARLADVAFARHENQDVAAARFGQDLLDGAHGGVHIGHVAALLGRLVQRRVEDLHRIQPAGHLDDRRVVEGARERLGINRGRGDDELEIAALGEQALEVAEQKINVQAALVRLVNDDGSCIRRAADRPGSRPAGCRRSSA
jgi:hypothetical protein